MDYILEYTRSSRKVKELENRLAYTVSRYEKEIANLKKEILMPRIKFTTEMGAFEKVMQVVCMVCNVTPADVIGRSRKREIMIARHLVAYSMRHDFAACFKQIGLRLGGRDHSTMINSCNVFSDFLDTDKSVQRLYATAKELLSVRVELMDGTDA
ncbi:helix-turn-helix domain-containing protein [Runella sp.]|uniref:helix-turn-helix domain-containing protein n=1 Tax=Runella sp. TaxID=1960881 RepID=UPI003019AD74